MGAGGANATEISLKNKAPKIENWFNLFEKIG